MPPPQDHPTDEPDQQGISLEELSRAYASAMGARGEHVVPSSGSIPVEGQHGEAEAEVDAELDLPPADQTGPDDDPCPISPESIFEAMLFVGDRGNEPLTPAKAAGLMRGVEPSEIPPLVDKLNRRYEAAGCPYRITGEGPGYRLVLSRRFDWLRNKLYGRVREAQLSQAAIDVLAILAYRQPLTAEEVSRLRGTASGHILSQLVHRRLVGVERSSGPRRAARYSTTERFLELFGLEAVEELPQAEEVEPR